MSKLREQLGTLLLKIGMMQTMMRMKRKTWNLVRETSLRMLRWRHLDTKMKVKKRLSLEKIATVMR